MPTINTKAAGRGRLQQAKKDGKNCRLCGGPITKGQWYWRKRAGDAHRECGNNEALTARR